MTEEKIDVNKRAFVKISTVGLVAPLVIVATAKGKSLEHHVPPVNSGVRELVHIEAGDADWSPSLEELESLSLLFQQALNDPEGSIVATRQGVRVSIFQLFAK